MKAKDTIIQTNEENCHNTLEERLSEQAEVSFKLGATQAIAKTIKPAGELYQKAMQAGRQEVVEWLRDHCSEPGEEYEGLLGCVSRNLWLEEWQAQLKEWKL